MVKGGGDILETIYTMLKEVKVTKEEKRKLKKKNYGHIFQSLKK